MLAFVLSSTDMYPKIPFGCCNAVIPLTSNKTFKHFGLVDQMRAGVKRWGAEANHCTMGCCSAMCASVGFRHADVNEYRQKLHTPWAGTLTA